MKTNDFAIQARVRRALARRWIRPDCLEIGTTEGVVLLKGRLEGEPGSRGLPHERAEWDRYVQDLAGTLRAIPGVVDLVMELRQPERTDESCTGTES